MDSVKQAVVIKADRKWSKRNTDYYWELTMIDGDNGRMLTTYATESYGNFRIWEPIIRELTKDVHRAVIIVGNMRLKGRIVNADSVVRISDTVDYNTLHKVYTENFM
jgi:hypothetical protein